ncbi:mycofactocin biosynthesis peptidyl-dipeptidase MftE [Actinospica sp.]|jgi:creatinine amidohydrolase|uniref:mycofactocin biosynthesis peptidyl-dipeptidase MftE n=1 Tax=Actinospica sp. TaxID=1872142 RepID=UPI002CEB20CF|nr:mycofactocin biosynthesis peptidyl-dipeptidase MftE [Actinospica sp.]HWG26706.1 mycofactocin biosynthesis peptidyl-dipeptidase MftE [Actinospica sp.]
MWLAELTWPEVAERAAGGALLAVPMGSTEQHGPHLPLSTDADIAMALCERLAAELPDVLIAPLVPYGSSGEHAGFAGTLSIGQDATEHLALELGRSAAETFSRLLFVSGHGGNAEPLGRAVARLQAESRDVVLFQPDWENGDAHAGREETAMLLALRPAIVRVELSAPGERRPLAEIMPRLRAEGVRAVSPSGVLGDPTKATAVAGAQLLNELGGALVRYVEAWLGRYAGARR